MRTPAELQAEIDRLTAALGESERARTEAEMQALTNASMVLIAGGADEQPTGKTTKERRCVNPWEKDEDKQSWKVFDVPTYFYAIDLPIGAGTDVATNGTPYYHGQTYEVTHDQLVDLKSRVARCWDHEKSIHGENENAYRKPSAQHLVSAAARMAGAH